MRHLKKIFVLVAVLVVGACTSPGQYDNAGNLGINDASNPSSPAYFRATVGDRVLFVVNQSSLSDEARVTLDGQVAWLNANPEYDALIEGHADERGTREYNLALGARRANAVQEYLLSQGIAADQLRVVSFGKERPIAVCSNDSCYSQNRRAVTVISAGGLAS
ncbi:MAG: peptidoglycan-associated lipoprotein Pal [Halocynthiibacter sp.]